MSKPAVPALFALVVSFFGAAGCLSSSGSPSTKPTNIADTGAPSGLTEDGSTPDGAVSDDGSASEDGGDTGVPAPVEAGAVPRLVTGLGPGIVAHSAHFTIITKTGDQPGGAGVKTSASFTVISGAARAGTK